MQKIPAFTVIELILVMALSVLIIGIGGSAYLLIQRQQIQYETTTNEGLEINDFVTIKRKDWAKATTITYQDGIYQFTFPNYQIAYQIEENYITRHNDQVMNVVDTFRLKSAAIENYFQQQYINNGMIDRSRIEIILYEKTYPITFQKQYSATDLLQITQN